MQKLQFEVLIDAPVTTVFNTMLTQNTYRDWTSPFCEGSYYEGLWQAGEKIKFLSPSGEGMVSEIAEHRPNQFTSIRHLGTIANGVEDTCSAAVLAWAPAYENYTFTTEAGGTRITVDQDVMDEYAAYMHEVWPKALDRLKKICEGVSI